MIVYHFTANWCKPCEKIQPMVSAFIESKPDITYFKIDVDKEPEQAKNFSVLSVPTFVFCDNEHNYKNRHVGVITQEQLQNFTKESI